MIRKVVTALDVRTGEPREVVRLIPETAEDERELERLRQAGQLDERHAFSDDPKAWK